MLPRLHASWKGKENIVPTRLQYYTYVKPAFIHTSSDENFVISPRNIL